MKIDFKENLAGVPIRLIREFLYGYYERRWAVDVVEAAFPGSGEAVLDELIEQGYVQFTSEPGIYKTTLKGDLLAEARVRENRAGSGIGAPSERP
jgi:hypothetical protein